MMRRLFSCICALFSLVTRGQVNLQTGAAEFSLPLYNYTDPNNRLGLGMSLYYINGNGLKVSEMASSFGTGWSLQVGGEIVRIQNGEPDDQYQPGNPSFNGTMDWSSRYYSANYFPNGYLYAEPDYHPSYPVTNGGAWMPMFSTKQNCLPSKAFIADREQDEFQFTFNGRTGKFVIGKDGSIKSIEDTKLKIEKVEGTMPSNIRTKISEFTIVDESGIKYVFRDRELSEVLRYDQVQYSNNGYRVQFGDVYLVYHDDCKKFSCNPNVILASGLGSYTVSKWHLSEIINPLTNNQITFNYETYALETNSNISFQKSVSDGETDYSLTLGKVKGICKRITSISCSPKEQVKFVYGSLTRQDLPCDKYIDNIQVLYNGVCKTRWQFQLGYTGKNDIFPITYSTNAPPYSNDNPFLRLCLLSAQKIGFDGTSEPAYEFTYNLGNANNSTDYIPARFSYFHDHWGYSNIAWFTWQPNNDFGNSDPVSVCYSWGDYKLQIDDPITKRQPVDKQAQNGILNSIKYPTGGTLTFEYEQNTANYNGANVLMGGVRVKKTTLNDAISQANDVVMDYSYVKADGNSSGWGFEPSIYTESTDATVHKSGNSILAAANLRQVVSAIFIKKSSGPVDLVVSWLIDFLVGLFTPSYKDFTIYSTCSEPVNFGDGLTFQYSRVEVKSSQANNGKTVYEFTSPNDFALFVPSLGFPYASKQRYAEWAYGLPKDVYVYDNVNSTFPKKRTSNSYHYIASNYTNANFLSQKWAPHHLEYRSYTDYAMLTSTSTDYITSAYYYPMVGHTELYETKEYQYNNNGEYRVASTEYFYNSSFQLSKTKSYNSKNELVENYTYFPNDYTLTGAIQSMKDNNVLNTPIASQTFVTKNGGGTYALSGSLSEFGTISNGDLKLLKNYTFQNAQPVAASTVGFSPQNLNPNSQYYKNLQEVKYNTAGLPEAVLSNGRKVGKLFGYDNKLVIAEVSNASGGEAFFDSFEEPGIWSGMNYDNSKLHTGKLSGRIDNLGVGSKICPANNWLSITLSQSTNFKVSGWVYSDHPNAGVWLEIQYATGQDSRHYSFSHNKNKWVYIEAEFLVPANATGLRLHLENQGAVDWADYGGSIWYDDVRLHPSNARMVSYTYDPLIGLLSKTDVNNRSIFNEYDGLGRLIHVMDDDHNILKKYCYNYAGQPETCPVFSVGNTVKNKVFQKNNCETTAGYYGTQVTYSVHANKYFGSTQPIADALAQAEIDREGQAFANLNGGCLAGSANIQKSQTFTRNNCTNEKTGSQVIYVVPSGKYGAATLTLANQLADDDILTNGQAYANATGTCLYYSAAIVGNFYSRSCSSSQNPDPYPVSIPAGAFTSPSSQGDANYSAQFEAQRQADLYGQCSNSTVTIYARLEVAPSNYGSTNDGTEFYWSQEVSAYLRFYSDASCTQPLALPKTVSYTIDTHGYMEYVESYEYRPGYTIFQGTAPVGATEIFFDDILSFEGFWGFLNSNSEWDYYEKWKDDYELSSLGNGAIIRPAIYPAHTF